MGSETCARCGLPFEVGDMPGYDYGCHPVSICLARLRTALATAEAERDALRQTVARLYTERDVATAERDAAVERAERAWQPIETAPKDGTAIILVDWEQVCMLSGCPLMGACYWHDGLNEWCGAGGSADVEEPTHWMPLPALRAGEQTGEASDADV